MLKKAICSLAASIAAAAVINSLPAAATPPANASFGTPFKVTVTNQGAYNVLSGFVKMKLLTGAGDAAFASGLPPGAKPVTVNYHIVGNMNNQGKPLRTEILKLDYFHVDVDTDPRTLYAHFVAQQQVESVLHYSIFYEPANPSTRTVIVNAANQEWTRATHVYPNHHYRIKAIADWTLSDIQHSNFKFVGPMGDPQHQNLQGSPMPNMPGGILIGCLSTPPQDSGSFDIGYGNAHQDWTPQSESDLWLLMNDSRTDGNKFADNAGLALVEITDLGEVASPSSPASSK